MPKKGSAVKKKKKDKIKVVRNSTSFAFAILFTKKLYMLTIKATAKTKT